MEDLPFNGLELKVWEGGGEGVNFFFFFFFFFFNPGKMHYARTAPAPAVNSVGLCRTRPYPLKTLGAPAQTQRAIIAGGDSPLCREGAPHARA